MDLSTNTSVEITTQKRQSRKSRFHSPIQIPSAIGLDPAVHIRCLIAQGGQPPRGPHAVRSMIAVQHDQAVLRQLSDPASQFPGRNIHGSPDMCPAVRVGIPHIYQKHIASLIQVFIQLCPTDQIPHKHPPVFISYFILCRQAPVGQSPHSPASRYHVLGIKKEALPGRTSSCFFQTLLK